MNTVNKKQKVTRGFKEPLYVIQHEGKALAIVGARSEEQALLRADAIRRQVWLPAGQLLQAKFLKAGPVGAPNLSVPWFSDGYFSWLDSLDIPDASCPVCGR